MRCHGRIENDKREAESPASLGKVAPRQLAAHGLTRFDQLADRTERELLAIHRVGPKAIRILREELRSSWMGRVDAGWLTPVGQLDAAVAPTLKV